MGAGDGLVAQLCWALCDLMDVAHQAPLSMGFSRQEYCSGLPFSSPEDLPDSGIELVSLALQVNSLPLSHQGRGYCYLKKECSYADHKSISRSLLCYREDRYASK